MEKSLPHLYSLLLPGEETHSYLQCPSTVTAAGDKETQFWSSLCVGTQDGQGLGRKQWSRRSCAYSAGSGLGGLGLRKGEEKRLHLFHRLSRTLVVPGRPRRTECATLAGVVLSRGGRRSQALPRGSGSAF